MTLERFDEPFSQTRQLLGPDGTRPLLILDPR